MASRRKRKKQKVKETAPADPAEELRRKERANAVLLRDNFKGQLLGFSPLGSAGSGC